MDAVRALLGVSGKSNKGAPASKVSYRSYYDRGNERNDYGRTRTRVGYDYDDIVLDKRDEAEDVLSRMDELISTYGMASVADLYELVGVTGNYTDNKYGWIRYPKRFRNTCARWIFAEAAKGFAVELKRRLMYL